MTITILFLAIFSSSAVLQPAAARITVSAMWDRTYISVVGGIQSVEQTKDGGFIMAAESSGEWVMKANATGMPEWQREYTPTGYAGGDVIGLATRARDGGFVVAGRALSIHYVTGWDAWVLKLDRRGNVEWSRTYDLPGDEGFNSLQQASDGGYIALGDWTPVVNGFSEVSQAWLVKLSASGDVEWQHAYAAQHANSVQETFDGGFIVAGDGGFAVAGVPLSGQRAWLLKTDQFGNTVWQKTYAVPMGNALIDDHAYWIRQTADGGYIVAGDVIEWGNMTSFFQIQTYSFAWLLRLDSNGSIMWQRLVGGGGFTQPFSVSPVHDGGFVLSGRFFPSNPSGEVGGPLVGLSGAFLLKLNEDGNLLWQKIYGGVNDFLVHVQDTRDGGLIAVGSHVTAYPHCCGYVAWALKLNSDGAIPGCPIGSASNATLTNTSAVVVRSSVNVINSNATVNSTSVAVTTPSFTLQTLCSSCQSLARDHESHHARLGTMRTRQLCSTENEPRRTDTGMLREASEDRITNIGNQPRNGRAQSYLRNVL